MRAEVVSAEQDYESPASGTSLMGRIANPNNLRKAFQRVKRNKGVAGVDRMTVSDLFNFLQEHGRELRQCLLQGVGGQRAFDAGCMRETIVAGSGMHSHGGPSERGMQSQDRGARSSIGLLFWRNNQGHCI